MASPFVQSSSDTPGTNVATDAFTGVSSSHELIAIVVASEGTGLPTLTSVEETTTSTALTPLYPFTAIKVGGQPEYGGIGIYSLPSPPASPSVTATFGSGASGQLFLAESTLIGLLLDVASGVTEGTTTPSIRTSYSNELLIAVESYAFNYGQHGPYFTAWTNNFTEEAYSVSATYGPSTDWAYLQSTKTISTNVSASTSVGNSISSLLAALRTSTSAESPQLQSINSGLYSPVLGTITTSTTGGSLVGAAYSYNVTAYNSVGETLGSNTQSVSVPTTTSTNSNSLTWDAVANATGYKIYVNYVASGRGFFNIYDVGNVTSYIDTGATPTGIGTPPTISTANSTIVEGATAVPVVGSAFDSSLTISITQPNEVSVEQTVTYESATTATLDVVVEPATVQQLAFTDATYTTVAVATTTVGSGTPIPVTVAPPAGLIFVTLQSVNPTAANRICAIPDLVVGDQVEAAGDATGTTAPPAGTILHPDGTFTATQTFYARAYIAADQAWTPWTEIVCTGLEENTGFF